MKAARDPGATARTRRARRPRGSARSSGPASTRRPRRRSTCRSARTAGSGGCASSLADFKAIKNALGGTVNDVVLAVVSGPCGAGCGRAACGPRASSCARSCRSRSGAEGEQSDLGNQIAAMRGPLPVYVDDPIERLGSSSEAMAGLKESKQALGAEVIAGLQRLRPADAARPGIAAELLDPAVQPDRDERARAAVPALPARPRAAGAGADRVPARGPRAGGRDHELQRLRRLRPARRLRRDARHRRVLDAGDLGTRWPSSWTWRGRRASATSKKPVATSEA